ncbi:hypothetical protein WA026_002357 [Henosepilachna vigintioctopunctata]|uniref:Uncharacterized protein n=1 Tax=Henosepilachna vigintioctopunctata TaxID=420089 RepID=A0AAW1U231_9CUCU
MEFVRSISVSQSDDHESNIPPLSPASVASSCYEESPMDGASMNHEDATDTEAGGEIFQKTNPTVQCRPDLQQKFYGITCSIEKTVRTLPPHMQIRLKFRLILKLDSQISTLVHNAELENIQTIPIHSHHNVPHPFVNNQTYENNTIYMYENNRVFILACNY